MTAAIVGGASVTYTYRGDNLRHSKVVGGGNTTYTYVYGLGLISQTDGSGNATYTLPDGLGSNDTTTNGSGAVGKSYKYDVFGNVRSSSGSGDDTQFQFAGQQTDADADLIYLRALLRF